MLVPSILVAPLLALADLDPAPEPEDVKAGYPALFLFLGMLLIIGLLGWSLARHLRKAEANRDAGLFGDPPSPGTQQATGASVAGGPGSVVGERMDIPPTT